MAKKRAGKKNAGKKNAGKRKDGQKKDGQKRVDKNLRTSTKGKGCSPRTPPLPEDIDPRLWFYSTQCDGLDYLFDAHWHTHPGRMAAYCPHEPDYPDYRISLGELPADLPRATRYFVQGFLAGSLPEAPDADFGSPEMLEWEDHAREFARTGLWRPAFD